MVTEEVDSLEHCKTRDIFLVLFFQMCSTWHLYERIQFFICTFPWVPEERTLLPFYQAQVTYLDVKGVILSLHSFLCYFEYYLLTSPTNQTENKNQLWRLHEDGMSMCEAPVLPEGNSFKKRNGII